jgi:hypothetical protein
MVKGNKTANTSILYSGKDGEVTPASIEPKQRKVKLFAINEVVLS